MKDPYVYRGTDVLKNLANIKDADLLGQMEAEYTSCRLSDLVINDFVKPFNYEHLCCMHYEIFQDVYEWAGKIRTVDIEKEEPALGGISVEYSHYPNIKEELNDILDEMNHFDWDMADVMVAAVKFSEFMGKLWKIHPFREGNTRTIIIFLSNFIESKGWYIDSDLFRENAQYMRTSLVAATAIFHDLGDKRRPEYLERIVLEALKKGLAMKNRVIDEIEVTGRKATSQIIRKIVFWNRREGKEHGNKEIKEFLETTQNDLSLT